MSSESNKAVFLSYASQDAEAVERIADALRAAGVEVWFDQSELRGGDAWDRKIRQQIKECALFVPIISANTQARLEGYFRLEWKLAEDRSHLMAKGKPFLVPVVVDTTSERDAHVPDAFLAVQWTRLPDGETSAAFCDQVRRLLGGSGLEPGRARPGERGEGVASPVVQPTTPQVSPVPRARRLRPLAIAAAVAAAIVVLAGGWWAWRAAATAPEKPPSPIAPNPSPAAAPAAEKSLVVLPLENLSPDPENAFFTEGMHAEIISTLQRATDLRVIGRDTALAFKRGAMTVADFARRLGAANVLTGSVRRAGTKALILLELRRASDDALLWSSPRTERDLSDILTVQSEVAEQVARTLKAREISGSNAHARYLTRNPRAFDLFVKGDQRFFAGEFAEAIPLYIEAFDLDRGYVVPAYMLGHAYCNLLYYEAEPAARLRHATEARRWIDAVALLDPNGFGAISESHYASNVEGDYLRALELAERGTRALPNENAAHTFHAIALEGLGRMTEALESYRRAIQIDPLLVFSLNNEARALVLLRREPEAMAMLERIMEVVREGARRDGTLHHLALQSFRMRGTLPKSIEAIPSIRDRAVWLWRARRFAEAEEALARVVSQTGLNDVRRFELRLAQHDALLRLGRSSQAEALAGDLLELARKLQSERDVGPARKAGWLAQAEARAGHAEAAIAAGRRFVEDASPTRQPMLRWQRETALAELYAYLARPRECCELLAKLLRVPSGLTVPMLKVDPTWDNVREDAAFKALLADPKNSEPL